MAKALVAAELRGLSRDALNSKVNELKEELFTLRFAAATGQLESHGRLRTARKDIARIYTVLQERNLGIVPEPDQDGVVDGESTTTQTTTTEKAQV